MKLNILYDGVQKFGTFVFDTDIDISMEVLKKRIDFEENSSLS